MPIFRDTATLYHHLGGERWRRDVLTGVLWRQTRERASQRLGYGSDPGGGMALVSATTLRVPASQASGLAVSPGGLDVLVRGSCSRELGPDYSLADLRRDEPTFCTVRSVLDATDRAHLPQLILTAV